MIDMQKFSQWIATVQGQYINMDGAYGAQCWDLHAHFADWFGLPRVDTGYPGRWAGWAGNMYDAYPQTPAIEAAYERIPGSQPAQAGDTAIWDDSFWYYPKTHVAEVVKDGAQLLCMSQNSTPSQAGNPYPLWSTGPTTLQHLPKGGLLGYLRPRTGTINPQGTTTTSEEDDMPFTAAEVQQLVTQGVQDYFRLKGEFQEGRNAIDHLNQIRTEVGNTKASVEHVPSTILYEERVGGRNIFDWLKHNVAVTAGIKPGTIDIEALASALSEQLEAKDIAALAEQLQITVKEA